MKKEPCVRFGIRINPKMSEKPADKRNKSPPSVMLLTVSNNHKFINGLRLAGRAAVAGSGFQRRIIARIDRLREEPVLLISPELAHILIGLDNFVDELAVLFFDPANVDVADDI